MRPSARYGLRDGQTKAGVEIGGGPASVPIMRRLLWLPILALVVSCGPREASVPVTIPPALAAKSAIPDPGALACAKCHAQQHADWMASQHANANRLVDAKRDAAAFAPAREVRQGSFVTRMQREGDAFVFTTAWSNQPATRHVAEAVIGITPLIQYLVTAPGGRLQVVDMSYDPRSNEWFNAQGSEDRQPHEWGYWKNRSMTWNVQCAFCHTTGLRKNYDESNDTYRTTWTAMGVSCVQCHPLAAAPGTNGCPVTPAVKLSATQSMENCASCHSRREVLDDAFVAGAGYHDHYRLALPERDGLYYADGQVRDEDFEFGSFQMSRMGHKGVTCFDCHFAHSGKLKLPWENSALCMQCHAAPGARGAIAIDPATHSGHKPDTPGGRCVDCHMPVTHYMVRDPRRDHGFTSPDPQLTLDLGIPNACNGCHTTQTVAWARDWTVKQYGAKMDRPARRRAYLLTRAWNGDPKVGPELLAAARGEEVAAWRATLDFLLSYAAATPAVRDHLAGELTNASPLVRSAAVRALHIAGADPAYFAPMLADTTRLVRLDAAMAMYGSGQPPPRGYNEVRDYLAAICDQPAGALRRAEFSLSTGQTVEAERWARRAAEWDSSAVPQHALGRIMHALGKSDEAGTRLKKAIELAPQESSFRYDYALFLAETGNAAGALEQLKETVRVEPRFGRAWYNLGLSHAGAEQLDEAAKALQKAADVMPDSPDAPFALATVYARQNKNAEARAAAERALKIAPGHQAARQLIDSLPR